jgi:hypothetical protein
MIFAFIVYLYFTIYVRGGMHMIYNTLAHIGDTHPCQVSWLGADHKPLDVQNVEATLFHYVEDVRTILDGPNAMEATDQAHRFVYSFVIPEVVLGQTIFVEFKAELVADNTLIYAEQTISVSAKDTFINVV